MILEASALIVSFARSGEYISKDEIKCVNKIDTCHIVGVVPRYHICLHYESLYKIHVRRRYSPIDSRFHKHLFD